MWRNGNRPTRTAFVGHDDTNRRMLKLTHWCGINNVEKTQSIIRVDDSRVFVSLMTFNKRRLLIDGRIASKVTTFSGCGNIASQLVSSVAERLRTSFVFIRKSTSMRLLTYAVEHN